MLRHAIKEDLSAVFTALNYSAVLTTNCLSSKRWSHQLFEPWSFKLNAPHRPLINILNYFHKRLLSFKWLKLLLSQSWELSLTLLSQWKLNFLCDLAPCLGSITSITESDPGCHWHCWITDDTTESTLSFKRLSIFRRLINPNSTIDDQQCQWALGLKHKKTGVAEESFWFNDVLDTTESTNFKIEYLLGFRNYTQNS